MSVGGGVLPASHFGKSRSGIGFAYKTLQQMYAVSAQMLSLRLGFNAFRHQFYIQFFPKAIMMSVTVEFTASVPMAEVNDLSIFSTSGRSFSSRERAVAGTEIINRQFYAKPI